MLKTEINVAIALIIHEQSVLVGLREQHQHQGNKNEFPGGKLEQGETPDQACQREVLEEVGINLIDYQQVDCIHHEYDDVIVNLHVYLTEISKMQAQKINLPWFWVAFDKMDALNFPKANHLILQRFSRGDYFYK
ncbi:(deoxy)nucleoside triphosphate pyrophosphohydrolase [Acinetobacter sp. B10A]|uniref:(deoxy)nucleoside triphosphate pyrophosphohydrolase n=1 Tax=Acinetobacter baretiae TaxID=2605383 RepID=UPI001B3C8869|nr:(deoxy)nucleoside triphosphate pyrophosphohydrolase [Acinetobacter baretiae]MBF7684242.1 (deoxy)nucleoside triphosphate pyrophosphohydrolase [Acinetobacter baretiae]